LLLTLACGLYPDKLKRPYGRQEADIAESLMLPTVANLFSGRIPERQQHAPTPEVETDYNDGQTKYLASDETSSSQDRRTTRPKPMKHLWKNLINLYLLKRYERKADGNIESMEMQIQGFIKKHMLNDK